MDKQAVINIIKTKAPLFHLDPMLLLAIGNIESGLDPLAKASTSSAAGLFQFIDSTWLNLLLKYGPKWKTTVTGWNKEMIKNLKFDPVVSTLMMGELVHENKVYLATKMPGYEPTNSMLYLAHFFGPSAALRFLTYLKASPDSPACDMFKSEAKANPSVFYKVPSLRLKPKTYEEINQWVNKRLLDYSKGLN